jgi:primosomal protein N' (replication factor Y)
MPKKIAKVVVTLPVEGPFDYRIPESCCMQIASGQRVHVPFGNKNMVGFVVGVQNKSRVKQLKSILSILDNIPALNDDMLRITKDFSQYYGCSWGEAIETSLPSALRKRKELQLEMPGEKGKKVGLKGELVLCHDKGKTQRWPFIIEQIKNVILKGQGVIVLVPETYLIKKTKKFIEAQCNIPVAILDRKMTPKKELEQWISVKEGRSKIVIGTRSAVFAPVSKLGLIIIIEEENWSYKQEQSPFYHTSHIAKMRALQEGSSVIFVSSAPSAELWWKVQKGDASLRAFEPDKLSKMQVIDMSNYKFKGKASISFPLQNYIQETLSAKGKVLLFLNRRGFSTMTRCNKCGFIIKCDRCNVSMSYLFAKKKLV